MLEGSRHEKVAIVITAYIIGFATAYIAFGVNQLISGEEIASAPSQFIHKKFAIKEDLPKKILSIGTNSDGLSVVTSEKTFLLSANKNDLGASAINSKPTPGFNVGVFDAEVSRDGNFAFYCEQISAESATCNPYIFSNFDAKLHAVKVDGKTYTPTIENHNFFWTQDNKVSLDGNLSNDSLTPWNLTKSVPEDSNAAAAQIKKDEGQIQVQ